MQATVTVIDQYGNPVDGATLTITNAYGFTVDSGFTGSNGQYVSVDLPFPDEYGFDHYVITVDFYAATNSATVDWYGEASVTLQLNIYEPSYYDIIVVAGQGGTTNPAPGHYTGQGIIYVTAIPNSGYVFDHWNLNGVFLTSDTTFHTGASGTFTAFFTTTTPPPPPPPPPGAVGTRFASFAVSYYTPPDGSLAGDGCLVAFNGVLEDVNGNKLGAKLVHIWITNDNVNYTEIGAVVTPPTGAFIKGILFTSPSYSPGTYYVHARFEGGAY